MKNILVFAPHPDDEILGCGGTILKEIQKGNNVYVCIVTHAEPPVYPEGASKEIQECAKQCHRWMGVKETFFLNFPAVMLENVGRYLINNEVLKLVQSTKANEVYLPHYGDMQKDHQIVAEACMVAVRPKYGHTVRKVYGYETLSETGWNTPNVQNDFIPNSFCDITDYLEGKKEALKYYESQLSPFPDARSLEAIEALARYRGALMNFNAAEAFMIIREYRQKMNKTNINIVVPIYQLDRYIGICIESLLNQTYEILKFSLPMMVYLTIALRYVIYMQKRIAVLR